MQPSRFARWFDWAAGMKPVWVFVLVLTAARVAYLIWWCPYTLAEDEAHYWEWARRLAWSYYSKGPGVAWAIAAATSIFGNIEWAVRLPAVLAAGVGSLAAAGTARAIFDDRRVGFFAAVLYQCIAPFSVLAMIMTIDGPYLACWALTLWCAARAWRSGRGAWLIGAGVALALGFVFKYTIVLLAVGILIAAVLERKQRRFGIGVWLASAAAFALGLAPVLIWNATHEWATVHHLLGHLGVPGGDVPATQGSGGGWHYNPMWTLGYLGMLAIAGPVGFLGVVSAEFFFRARTGVRLLVWASTPILVFYFLTTFLAQAEGNWAFGGFVALAPLAAGAIPIALEQKQRRGLRFFAAGALALGVATTLLFPSLPLVSRLPGVGCLIPLHRLTGLRKLSAAATDRLHEIERETGKQPFVMTGHYGRASQLAFYLPGQPIVYCAGSLTWGGRKSQYDEWPETDLRNPATSARLEGRSALLFGGEEAFWLQGFESVEGIENLPGEPKPNRHTWIGTNFHGFEP